jgi:biotin synthase
MRQRVCEILGSVLNGSDIDRESASELSSAEGTDLWDLFAAAGRVRDHFRGSTVDICSIVNAKSGACSEDCSYCAQSIHHATGARSIL